MSRIVRCSLIQATNAAPPDASLDATKQAMIDKHVGSIRQAASDGALGFAKIGVYICYDRCIFAKAARDRDEMLTAEALVKA